MTAPQFPHQFGTIPAVDMTKVRRASIVHDFTSHEADTCETLGPVPDYAAQWAREVEGYGPRLPFPPKPTLWQRIRRALTGYPIDRED